MRIRELQTQAAVLNWTVFNATMHNIQVRVVRIQIVLLVLVQRRQDLEVAGSAGNDLGGVR